MSKIKDNTTLILSLIAAIITIVVFVSGKNKISDFFEENKTEMMYEGTFNEIEDKQESEKNIIENQPNTKIERNEKSSQLKSEVSKIRVEENNKKEPKPENVSSKHPDEIKEIEQKSKVYFNHEGKFEYWIDEKNLMTWYEAQEYIYRVNREGNRKFKIPSQSEIYLFAKNRNKTHNLESYDNSMNGIYWTNNSCIIKDGDQRCLEYYSNKNFNSDVAYAVGFHGVSGTYKKTTKLKLVIIRIE